MNKATYNERIFSGRGLRSALHFARFHWVQRTIERFRIPVESVVELGCYDGRLLDWLPRRPQRYLGIDANWEGGLDLARERFANDEWVTLVQASSPADVHGPRGSYGLGVSLETLEHVPEELLPDYLRFLSEQVTDYLLVSVPNEMGPVFAAKWCYKRLVYSDAEGYTAGEFLNACLYRPSRVRRVEHKGFDYRQLKEQMSEYFEVVHMAPIPRLPVPLALAFGVGIVARKRGGGTTVAARE